MMITGQQPWRRRRGFTLVEVLVACGVSAVLVGAIGSVLVLAGRAVPSAQANESAAMAMEVSAVLDRIAGDLTTATAVTGDSGTVRVWVPDRDNDGNGEEIEYVYKGDGSLYCSINGGAQASLLDGLSHCAIRYATVDESVALQLQDVAPGAETLIRSQDATVSSNRISIHRNQGVGATFQPTDPTGPWSVSRVRVRLRESSSNDAGAAVAVRVYMADATGAPSGSPLAETLVYETSLNSSTPWRSVVLNGATNIPPTAAVCIVVIAVSGLDPAQAVYEDSAAASAVMWRTTTGGSSWFAISSDALALEVYGAVGGYAETSSVIRLVERVSVDLSTGGKSPVSMSRTVRLLNRPEAQ